VRTRHNFTTLAHNI